MKAKFLTSQATFGILLAMVTSASAQIITFSYEGTVTDPVGPTFLVGDPVQVTYSFDSTTPDSSPDPSFGNYNGTVQSLSFSFGSYSGYADPGARIEVGNDGGNQDYYLIVFEGSQAGLLHGPTVNGWTLTGFTLQLVDKTHTAFSSDALPITPPDPAQFTSPLTYLSLKFEDSIGQPIGGPISRDFAPVPEPSHVVPVCLALSSFVCFRAFRKLCRNGGWNLGRP